MPGYGQRPAFNPLEELAATPAWAWTFLAIRFFGLVVVVPVIEEFFLRGFLMRLVVDQDWWKVPFGKVNAAAVAVSIVVPVLTHQPGEFLAAAAWFGMVTWLMVRTRNPWDCVLAHAVTNLLLGIYVVARGAMGAVVVSGGGRKPASKPTAQARNVRVRTRNAHSSLARRASILACARASMSSSRRVAT